MAKNCMKPIENSSKVVSKIVDESPFFGSGEMADRMRSFDWESTPVGPPEHWPQSLRTIVRIMLTSRYQMWMGWGSDLTFFFNDAYRPTLGVKEAWALGASAREVWAEIWSDIGPRIDRVLQTGESTWDEGLLLFLERSGFPEETYHTFSYSPLFDDGGKVAGMFCVVTEETERIIGERRLGVLRKLAERLASPNAEPDVFAAIRECLSTERHDLPFTLLYRVEDGENLAKLAATTGIAPGHPAAPASIDRTSPLAPWPMQEVLENRSAVFVDDLASRFGALPGGPWPKPPTTALLVPIARQGQSNPAGIFIAGLNAYREFDADYRSFVDLFVGQIAAGLSNAHAYEAERRRAQALAEIDRAKTAFFSNVSHEFRTPLTLMLGPVEDLLAKSNLEHADREQVDLIYRNGLRLLKLVNTLLDFSRIEAGRVKALYQPTDLARLTSELSSVFRSAIEKAGLRLIVDTPPLNSPAYVDRDMWEKIVLNLLSNAFKFTHEGTITVRLSAENDQFILEVRDTGVGIPANELPRLFERFHRVEGTRGRTHEGTGIGLALVQELVHLHGGAIRVQSEVGKGTAFTVSIPQGKEHLQPDRIGEARSPASSPIGFNPFVAEALRWLPDGHADGPIIDARGSANSTLLETAKGATSAELRERVLLADDNADMREYVTRLLADRYEIKTFGDGQEALEAAREWRPALILSDIMMPRLDGFGLIRAIRSDSALAAIPVILLSARAGEEATVEGMQAGADDYIVKPFGARELIARVDRQIERKRYERKLAAAEQRLHSAFLAARMAAWEWDPRKDVVTASETAGEIYGFLPGETLHSSAQGLGLVHPEDRPRHESIVRTAAERCEGFHSEFRIIRPVDGRIAWLEERGTAMRDPRTGVVRLNGLVMDVTDRKVAETALKESESRAKFIVRLEDATRHIVDPDAVSRIAVEILGKYIDADRVAFIEVDADDDDQCTVIGEYCHDVPSIIGKYRFSDACKDLATAMRANHPFVECDTLRDGLSDEEKARLISWKIGAYVSAPLHKGGKLVAAVSAHQASPRQWSATEVELVGIVANRCWESIQRARAERALRASEERLAFAVEAAELGTFYCPLPFSEIEWNAKCKEHFWLPPDAKINLELFYSRIHPDDVERTRIANERAIAYREPYDCDYRVVAPDGRVRWVRAKGRAYYDIEGAPVRFDGVTLDITELKGAEKKREEILAAERAAREEAERVSRMKDEFLATLSHELRTPLNAILGWSQILGRGPLDLEDAKEGLQAIERNARSQTQMIEDLLDMSRIISGKVRLEVQRVSLADILEQAVQSVLPAANGKGVRLTRVIDPHVGPVSGDPGRLQQVFWNLLTNAIKFTPRDGKIQIVLQRVNSHVEISVSDTGEGIDPEFIPHVFERFRQADASTTRRHGGLGLGLNIVKQLAELHGGSVSAHSLGKGKGATFIVALPGAAIARDLNSDAQQQRLHPRSASGEPAIDLPDLSGVSILVVDDDPDARELMRRILAETGASILAAGSAPEALKLVRESRPELLISDIGMPGEDGYELIRKIRSLPPELGARTPAVALTAFARSEDRQRALRAGYQMHVAKPVEPSELLTVCMSLVGRVGK
jgi:PAS domain S-box-containing protein